MADTPAVAHRFRYMQKVRLLPQTTRNYSTSRYPYRHIENGTEGYITRMGSASMLVRFPIRDGRESSVWIEAVHLEPVVVDPNAPVPRKLGEKPEGEEFIGPDHPGLQWLWEDAAQVADRYGHCSEYDKIADNLGIPGRKRKYNVKVPLTGEGVSGTVIISVEARSRSEAEKNAQELLSKSKFDKAAMTISGG